MKGCSPSSLVLSKTGGLLSCPSPIRVKANTWISYWTNLRRFLSKTDCVRLPLTTFTCASEAESFSLYITWKVKYIKHNYSSHHCYAILWLWLTLIQDQMKYKHTGIAVSKDEWHAVCSSGSIVQQAAVFFLIIKPPLVITVDFKPERLFWTYGCTFSSNCKYLSFRMGQTFIELTNNPFIT